MKSMFLSFIFSSLLYVNLFAGCCNCCKSRTPKNTGIHLGSGNGKTVLLTDTDKSKLPHFTVNLDLKGKKPKSNKYKNISVESDKKQGKPELYKDLNEPLQGEGTDKTELYNETAKETKLEIDNEIVTINGNNILKQLDNDFILNHITKNVDYVTRTFYEINKVYFESKISIDLKLKDNIQYIIATVKTHRDKYYLLKIIISNSGTVEKPEFKADDIFNSEYGSIVTKIIILSSSKNITSLKSIFANRKKLIFVDLSGLNTQNVTNMYSMFYNCKNLTTIDGLSLLDTKNVADMSSMFEECKNLTSLDLSKFNTQNVTTMSNMFCSCNNLTSLDLSKFNTQNVTDMSGMFKYCDKLETIYLPNFNTQKDISVDNIFYSCYSLEEIYVSRENSNKLFDGFINDLYEYKYDENEKCFNFNKKETGEEEYDDEEGEEEDDEE